MPVDPAIASAAIQSAGQFTNVGANTVGQVLTNRRNRRFSREMYERTKQDNIAFWHMQNEYNSPAKQMSRFQEAGLNPHLIYGQGNSGNASPVATPDVQSAQARAPEIDFQTTPIINSYFDTQIKQAQLDNLKASNTVILEDANLKAAQTRATLAGANRSEFDYGFESELRPYSLDFRKEGLRQRKVDIDISINRDAREAAMNASNLREAIERMSSMQQHRAQSREEVKRILETTKLLKQDQRIKDFEIELREDGLNPNDPTWMRIISTILEDAYETFKGERSPGSTSIYKRLEQLVPRPRTRVDTSMTFPLTPRR